MKRNNLFTAYILPILAAVLLGLLFYCVVSEAADYELPEAGFIEFIEEIEPEEIIFENPHELFETPIEPTYILSDREVDLLLQIGTLEAGCDGVDGMANVMQVILNRVESDTFPDTVEEVIFQTNPIQFTTASMLGTANITAEAYEALDAVVFGEYQENDTHFFESCEGKVFSSWADYSFTYGGHDFYKLKER